MRNSYKHIISIAGLGLAMLFFSCKNDLQQIKIIDEISNHPTIEVDSLKTSYTIKGYRKGTMVAPVVHIFQNIDDPYYDFPKGMYVEFYTDSGLLQSTVTANYAKYLSEKQIWDARYNVKAVNLKGDTLQSEQVYIDEKKQEIYTDKRVQITSPDGMRIVGQDGFTSNLEFTEYRFKKVTGIFNVRSMSQNDSLANQH
ncbi:MAG: hypothetical protein RIS47_1618 [Bacteroidota bacterium]|jgi:LPS export ABC transporter protein LptC